MAESIAFIEKTKPKYVLEIISSKVLERLLDSYRFHLQTALTVYFNKSLLVSIERFELKPRPEEMRLTCPFCYIYRYTLPKCDENCTLCDKKITLKYYNGTWRGPKLFHCPLHLWDMTYPLFAGEQQVGVLYGGQVIVTEEVEDWCVGLKDVMNEVVWDPFNDNGANVIPSKSNQVEEILAKVNVSTDITQDKKKQLHEAVEEQQEKRKTSIEDLVERYKKFKEFGKTIEEVLEDLYAAKAEAARREHIHRASRDIADRGDRLSEESEQFWNVLDEAVKNTLPDVKGYVLYRLDEYREAYKPVRTHIYYKEVISAETHFRNFCRYLFDELRERGKKRQDSIVYELLDEATPQKFRDLFHRGVSDWDKVMRGTSAIAIPLAESDGKIAGGLVCVCVKGEQRVIDKRDSSESSLKFYIEAMENIVDVLSMVFDRNTVVEAQASAWAVRAHELVAPITAVKGYHDNMKYMFGKYINPLRGVGTSVKEMLEARISRLGKLCNLLELIATGGSVKGGVRFTKANLTKDVLLPIVQPLRDYGENEKDVSVYYLEELFNIPNLFLYIDGIKRCIFNLVFNGIKYSNKKTTVYLNIAQTTDNYKINVVNEGIGVPKSDEERIFRMFTQGSNAYKVAAYGAGLGLYVARQMARIHGGDVKLVSGDQKSTVFSLTLPTSLRFKRPTQFSKEL